MILACILVIIFCIALIAYSYVLYPILLRFLVKNKQFSHQQYNKDKELPHISIMMSALNEERIIEKKIHSIFDTSYPLEKIHVYIGSDYSIDKTNKILQDLSKTYSHLHFNYYEERRGKANVLNSLKKDIHTSTKVVVLTDANVLFTKDTLFHLAKHFKDEQIGQVGANIINYFEADKPISQQENYYIQRENSIKYNEGLFDGSMIGAFGACYAIRRDLLIEFQQTFLMEDFYLSLSVLQKKYKAILDKDAICYEDLPGIIEEEYKRKKRISAGNYQNMMAYLDLLLNIFSKVGFCYWSHKLLRWFTPFFLIIIGVCTILLGILNFIPIKFIIGFSCLIIAFWVIDYFMEKAHKQIVILRFVRYFIYMNLAMLQGFFMYIKGIKTNVWTPTKREN